MSSNSDHLNDSPGRKRPTDDAGAEGRKRSPVGIDNRNESTRRYGGLEPEGYARHQHGNREGEYQQGGKGVSELPVEEGAPMKDARFRSQEDKSKVGPDEYGGRSFDSQPGDRDIVEGQLDKKPRETSSDNRPSSS